MVLSTKNQFFRLRKINTCDFHFKIFLELILDGLGIEYSCYIMSNLDNLSSQNKCLSIYLLLYFFSIESFICIILALHTISYYQNSHLPAFYLLSLRKFCSFKSYVPCEFDLAFVYSKENLKFHNYVYMN